MLRLFLFSIFVASCTQTVLVADQTKPNVIVVVADDLGWAELGCYANHFNETPNLDKLAKDGLRFTQAYSVAPVCSPYRAAFLTGQYPARFGIVDYLRPNSANALSTDHKTLPEMFQQNGYATGMIGKWHLSGYKFHGAEHEIKPKDHGFDWDFGREIKGVGNGANFWPYVFRNQKISWIDIVKNRLGKDEYLADRMNAEAVDFIARNRDRPFFLYLSHYAPHSILNGKPKLVAKYRKKHPPGKSTRKHCYLCEDQGQSGDTLNHWAGDHNPHLAAMLESIDDGIGLIRKKLRQHRLAENTIIIFTSDNGGETNVTSNAPLRGGKSQLYEGGIRVPMIVSWPKQIPKHSQYDWPTMNFDLYPTLLQAAGIERDPKQKLDGVSTLEIWKDPDKKINRKLYWHYPLDRPHFLGGKSAGAIRDGDWKLIEFFDTGETELYSLKEDLAEKNDLAKSKPEIVKAMKSSLQTWRESVNARTPSPPLLVETRQLLFADHFSTGQVSSRWAFSKEWSVEKQVLQRARGGDKTARIFLKGAKFHDVMIRFDFQFQKARDIRLVTGAGGPYNAVVHIRRDHFFIQTALDKSGPYFPRQHGECAFAFKPNKWYSMTVEFIGDQLVAHIDHGHLAYAKHPILNKERDYFAFQVDSSEAAFDNVQILNAARHRDYENGLTQVTNLSGKSKVERPLTEQFAIQKMIAHDSLYQTDQKYRKIVKRLEQLDKKNKVAFPNVFLSHKEFHQRKAARRKSLLENDPKYKELLFATYLSDRGIEAYLKEKHGSFDKLPVHRRKQTIAKLRIASAHDPKFIELLRKRDQAKSELEKAYPKLKLSDAEITKFKQDNRDKVKSDPAFRKLVEDRAAAWRAQQAYLLLNDVKLAKLQKQISATLEKKNKQLQ